MGIASLCYRIFTIFVAMGSTLKIFVFMFVSILLVSGVQLTFVDVEDLDAIPLLLEEEQEEDTEEDCNVKSECKITASQEVLMRKYASLEQPKYGVPNIDYSTVYLDLVESPPELLT